MPFLTRDTILGVDDRKVEDVSVPEWGGTVLIRGMTGKEREQFEDLHNEEVPAGNRAGRRAGQTVSKFDRKNLRSRLVVWCVIDDKGERLFSDADLDIINGKNGAALERIVDVAMRMSGMTDGDIDDLAQEMVSGKDPSADSS